MKVLVLGGGGREHALTWGLSRSSSVDAIYVMPGNGGTFEIAENVPGNCENPEEVLTAAQKIKPDLVVVGPEAPLVNGVADRLREEKYPVFGPSSSAAQIEGSKIFAKEIMFQYGVPTGKARFFNDFESARAYVESLEPPVVVKADGLAAGKGVIVASTIEEAIDGLNKIMVERKFGDAGKRVIIEEFLSGEEVSYFVLTDGKELIPLTSAQDYKRAYDEDRGPNTGGMGSYSPYPKMTYDEEQWVLEKIFDPVVYALNRTGSPYTGVLYGGLIKTDEGYKVLEFNCRFGDPETQVVVPRLKGDFAAALAAVAEGNLNNAPRLEIDNKKALTVVIASGGYPESYRTGFEISGVKEARDEGAIVFHAGTRVEDGKLVTAGGRVLNIVGIGESFAAARNIAYRGVARVFFENMHYRKDIGEEVIDY